MMKNYNEFCKASGCDQFIEWDHDTEYGPYPCTSCMIIGQSYNIDKYPEDCPFKEEISKIELERAAGSEGDDG